MTSQALTIKVHSGSNLVFSSHKPSSTNMNCSKAAVAALAENLREAQAQVNQILTEIIEKNADRGSSKEQSGDASGNEDDEDEDHSDSPKFKRKYDNPNKNSNSGGSSVKRIKSEASVVKKNT